MHLWNVYRFIFIDSSSFLSLWIFWVFYFLGVWAVRRGQGRARVN